MAQSLRNDCWTCITYMHTYVSLTTMTLISSIIAITATIWQLIDVDYYCRDMNYYDNYYHGLISYSCQYASRTYAITWLTLSTIAFFTSCLLFILIRMQHETQPIILNQNQAASVPTQPQVLIYPSGSTPSVPQGMAVTPVNQAMFMTGNVQAQQGITHPHGPYHRNTGNVQAQQGISHPHGPYHRNTGNVQAQQGITRPHGPYYSNTGNVQEQQGITHPHGPYHRNTGNVQAQQGITRPHSPYYRNAQMPTYPAPHRYSSAPFPYSVGTSAGVSNAGRFNEGFTQQ